MEGDGLDYTHLSVGTTVFVVSVLVRGDSMKKIVLVLLFSLLCTQAFAETKRFTVPLENSPSLGPRDAPITIVEFIDYQ
jgi:hypothetical protein